MTQLHTSTCRFITLLTILLLGAPSTGAGDIAREPVEQALWDLAGRRLRITWLQDTADGSDYLARGTSLQLMVLDSDDGLGERAIIPPGRNMAKPMFTADGERIVFSDRHAGTMHIVNRDGGDLETLGAGFALLTWRDPDTDVEWLYYAEGWVDDEKILPTHTSISRRALPESGGRVRLPFARIRRKLGTQVVWDQTRISEDSFQISADGRYASAVFPWPEVGVLDVRNAQWRRIGRGCWVALAPDNSYLLWILDGPHRNLTLFNTISGESWAVKLNELPGTGRYEVYHPRWSNHPRVLGVSGPYKVGEGSYRLPGGGAEVEIHVGRFSADFQSIEHWVRATYNNHANFYPDIWVEPDPDGPAAREDGPLPTLAPRATRWPLSDDSLLYLWEHGAAQNEVTDPHTGRRRIFRPEPRDLARYGRRHEMWLAGGYFIDPHGPALAREFSIECTLRSPAAIDDEALVIGYGNEFGLFEVNGDWILRHGDRSIPLTAVDTNAPVHLVIGVARDRLHLHVNGELTLNQPLASRVAPPSGGILHFGGHPELPGDWPGHLSHVALHGRLLSDREIMQHHRLTREELGPLGAGGVRSARARVVGRSALPTPEDIAPYRRALVVNEYELMEGEQAGERILVAHWAILDGRVLDTADRPLDAEYDLQLAPFEKRPELEGERLAMDTEDITLRMFYDLNL